MWGCVSAWFGRALAWHARGHRFDPGILHQIKSVVQKCTALFCLFQTSEESAQPEERRTWTARVHRDLKRPGILHQKEKHRTEMCGAFLFVRNFCLSQTSEALAQLGERLHGMQEVTGSIPVISIPRHFTRNREVLFILLASKCITILQILCKIKVEVRMDLVSTINIYPADKLKPPQPLIF